MREVDCILDGFLWPSDSGVLWANQTHGLACNHPSLEGVFVPFVIPVTIKTLMLNRGWNGTMADAGPELLEQLDAVFLEAGSPFVVCRDRLGGAQDDSGEAWLWVEVVRGDGRYSDALFNFVGERGVLVWTNSD